MRFVTMDRTDGLFGRHRIDEKDDAGILPLIDQLGSVAITFIDADGWAVEIEKLLCDQTTDPIIATKRIADPKQTERRGRVCLFSIFGWRRRWVGGHHARYDIRVLGDEMVGRMRYAFAPSTGMFIVRGDAFVRRDGMKRKSDLRCVV